MESIILHNGVEMPNIGLGTYKLKGKKGIEVMQNALKLGYRLFDSAQMYGNEKELGEAIRRGDSDCTLQRKELFITTKLSCNMSYKNAQQSIEQSLENLGLDFVDLLLIHEPYPNAKEMYKACEEAYHKGLTRAIGVSNFYGRFLEDFLELIHIPPMLNQIQAHIFFQQHSFHKLLESKGIHLQAWSPLASGGNGIFTNKTLQEIATTHKKSVAQIALRFLLERGISVIPKASTLERLQENLAVFDFSLTQAQKEAITQLDTNKSLFGWDC
ncbi:aldo/keto reductase [Helicobacter turcicus]|uniref:Aldo/keto reductase n=1 Tax=Helicobacter turcicus TaxID=2867412 RepID=A0ABS7JP19_9HELI|nr:aldo/keto reductase [Helicobacter turcicus]MBX7491104.1 aldo/keto reductase [Helicobacter turcicus]MBX7545968.1 aldo/keto reductase [Helicobacter turcicus]